MYCSEEDLREFGRVITSLGEGHHLSRLQTKEAYGQVILNLQPELQQGAFLAAHLLKGPTTAELCGVWDALYEYDTATISPDFSEACCDIVGTGSDALKTVNVSTPAAFIAAACGVKVAKKGARLVTGVSGATDIMEILGFSLEKPLAAAQEALEQHGICYLPGEIFLKSGWARLIRSMRFTSAFNIIGPLTKPCAKTTSIVIGAYAAPLCEQIVSILQETGMQAVMSPYGMSDRHEPSLGIDEVSVCGPTRMVELHEGKVTTYTLTPADFGVQQHRYSDIASRQDARANAQALLAVLAGQVETPLADLFAVNAACALRVHGVERDLKKATAMAKEAVASGGALDKVRQLVAVQGGEAGTVRLKERLAELA
ncbi:MAG: anthranilate phosphoribosyltransferase [Desulfobulbaceae bacterium]|nr:MAG: anthranilate phosphoribosyltransferase [Desulfobulbaceae bacterium]